jgi:hypothetical protein
MGGVACCLLLVLIYVLWPADFDVEVDVPGIKVTRRESGTAILHYSLLYS